jgi:translation initiation factor IF-2
MAAQTRPPVVTILGHVDHGKTTLLDYIRHSNVQAKEAGGITQHIGAYQVDHKGKKITFIDTPGHAAFAKMRQRGAQLTDIVVLVVAVNDGVKPQTIESIRHIKESNVSVVVALNKTDLKDTQPDVIKGELAQHDILVTDIGGEVEAVELSAKTGKGVDKLLETIAAMSELLELKADEQAPLEAVVIESAIDQHRGAIATVVVQQGTLKKRQELITAEGDISGKVRALTNELGQQLDDVLPGSPAEIQGLDEVPDVGSIIHDAQAEYKLVEDEVDEAVAPDDVYASWDFDAALEQDEKEKLKLIIKADVRGTLEAILQTIDEDSAEVISSGVGIVTQSDVEMAETTGALVIAFQIKVSNKVKRFAKLQGIKIKEYQIIYKLIEDLQKQMLKLIEPTIGEVQTGEAEVLQVFEMKGRKIAGCKVMTGEINKNDLLHLMRGDEIVFNPVIASMQHGKEEVDRVTAKSECGITFKNKKSIFQVGDKIIAYHEEDD